MYVCVYASFCVYKYNHTMSVIVINMKWLQRRVHGGIYRSFGGNFETAWGFLGFPILFSMYYTYIYGFSFSFSFSFIVDVLVDCDSNCASGCNATGAGHCDRYCVSGFGMTSYFTCQGNYIILYHCAAQLVMHKRLIVDAMNLKCEVRSRDRWQNEPKNLIV